MFNRLFRGRAGWAVVVAVIAVAAPPLPVPLSHAAAAHPPAEGEPPHIHLTSVMPNPPTIAPGTGGTRFVVKNPIPDEPLMDHERCRAAQGSYTVTVLIQRFAGPVDGETGTLVHAATMIENGLAERWCRLVVCAYVDRPGGCSLSSQDVLKVKFNGEDVAGMNAENPRGLVADIGGWHETGFWVPLNKVKFSEAPGEIKLPTEDQPYRPAEGEEPDPAENTVEVSIAVDNCYCFRIGWVSLEVKMASPLVLVHGNGQHPDYWRANPSEPQWPGFVAADPTGDYLNGVLIQKGIVPFSRITLLSKLYPDYGVTTGENRLKSENLWWEHDAKTLQSYFPAIATGFGVDCINTYGHSMGGLSLRGAIHNTQGLSTPKVISLITAGVPHEGSSLADLLVAYHRMNRRTDAMNRRDPPDEIHWKFSDGYALPGGMQTLLEAVNTYVWGNVASVHQLSVEFTADWNARNGAAFPSQVRLYAVGSDADLAPRDYQITSTAEYPGFVIVKPYLGWLWGYFGTTTSLVNVMYQFLLRDPSISVTLTCPPNPDPGL